jgi:hypothetical protein
MTQALALAPYQDDPEVVEVVTQARTIADEAFELAIVDEATNNRALNMLATARKYTKSIDALKKRWLDPLNDQIKLIRADFDRMAAPAKEADQILARKTADYRSKVQEAARKEQERLRLLAERRQEKAAARAEARGVEPPPVMPIIPTVAAPAKTIQVEGAKVTFRKQTHFEVVDPAQVPREYLSVDEKKVGAAVRAGIATPDNPIPGVRIWITEEAAVR